MELAVLLLFVAVCQVAWQERTINLEWRSSYRAPNIQSIPSREIVYYTASGQPVQISTGCSDDPPFNLLPWVFSSDLLPEPSSLKVGPGRISSEADTKGKTANGYKTARDQTSQGR